MNLHIQASKLLLDATFDTSGKVSHASPLFEDYAKVLFRIYLFYVLNYVELSFFVCLQVSSTIPVLNFSLPRSINVIFTLDGLVHQRQRGSGWGWCNLVY